MHKLTTANGHDVSMVGLGTYPFQGEAVVSMVLDAFKCGYRLVDTADDYRGKTGLGLVLSRLSNGTGFRREGVFIQTKISRDNAYGDKPLEGVWFNKLSEYQNHHTVEEVVMDKVTISLRKLQTDYTDSFLIHHPLPGYYEDIWDVIIRLEKGDKVRYIGVFDFYIDRLEKPKSIGEYPSIDQIYVSPLSIKHKGLECSINNAIQSIMYSPIMDLVHGQLNNNILIPLAKKYRKTKHQVILRWSIDRGCMPLPRTTNPNRLLGNFELFDFKLTKEGIEAISAMNRDLQILVESKQCPGL